MFGTLNRFSRYVWGVLAYLVGVILFGAWVRITGSGAGCGSHWPTCNGEVIPRAEGQKTLIEFTHRATSGFSLLLVLGLLIWAFLAYPKGNKVRAGSALVFVFLLLEALLGAGLVLFGLVEDDDSVARALVVVLHLVNTFALTGFGALTAWWAAGGGVPRLSRPDGAWLLLGLLGVLLSSVTGAITALGDTLFPVDLSAGPGLVERFQRDLSPATHFLVRLRIVHPIVAISVALYLLALTNGWGSSGQEATRRGENQAARGWSFVVSALVSLQFVVGFVNIGLAAPGWLQIIHLLLATLLWISLVLMSAATLTMPDGRSPHKPPLSR